MSVLCYKASLLINHFKGESSKRFDINIINSSVETLIVGSQASQIKERQRKF